MKGFVPVTKMALLTMIAACRSQVDFDYAEEKNKALDALVTAEKKRSTTRRFYRLWMLPAPRFAYNEADIVAWANDQHYDLFDESPFTALDKDMANTTRWLNTIERIGQSNHAGEPIELDIQTFNRLANPDKYIWVRSDCLFYTLRD